jgi:hypothetical protein
MNISILSQLIINPFSGRICYLSVQDGAFTKSALIAFDSNAAVKTACSFSNTRLGENLIHVKPSISPVPVAGHVLSDGADPGRTTHQEALDHHHFSQSEKPRSRILAEYLAYGYHLTDQIIAKGIEFDKANGVSEGFQQALKTFDHDVATWDSKHHVSEKAKQADEKHHFLNHAKHVWNSVESCFEKTLSTPKGLKLRKFYEEHNKEVHDVHNEARHLANLMKKTHIGHTSQPDPTAMGEKCTCGTFSVMLVVVYPSSNLPL